MAIRCKAAAANGGACSIHDGPDDAPYSDPDAHINRLYFHSSRPMPYSVLSRGGNFSVPRHGGNGTSSNPDAEKKKIILFAHARTYTPLVFGKWTLVSTAPVSGDNAFLYPANGTVMQAAGSVPLAMYTSVNVSTSLHQPFGRWLSLGVDATYVYCFIQDIWRVDHGLIPACTVRYDVEVMSTALVGTSPVVTNGIAFRINATKFEAGNGKFDSTRRYVRRATPSNYSLSKGKTIAVTGFPGIGVRYSFAGYTRAAYAKVNFGDDNAPASTFTGTQRAVRI